MKLYFVSIVFLIVAGFVIYVRRDHQKERARKLEEEGGMFAKGLHSYFIKSVSPRCRENMEVHSHVEKLWRWEKGRPRRFSRVNLEIVLFSEEISVQDIRRHTDMYIEENKPGQKFLMGRKIFQVKKIDQHQEKGEN